MDDKDRQTLAIAINELYAVVESLLKELEEKRGVNMPFQGVMGKMQRAKRKVESDLQRMTQD